MVNWVRCWRAPKWSPLWFRRLFPGCWTQAEVDDIARRAFEWAAQMEEDSE